jgi:chemotaxis protein CheD
MRHYGSHLPHHYLKPGEMFITQEPTLVTTLLGSCVAVTMFHPRRRVGAICHGLLPTCRDSDAALCTRNCALGFKFMDCSIQRMLEQFKAFGMKPREMEIKVFGGADMFGVTEANGQRMTIGRQNVAVTMRIFRDAGLSVLVEDVGGERGRKIFFYTHSGEILLKRLNDRR